MPVPLLTTGIVGVAAQNGAKIVGPGHASFLTDNNGEWFVVWHASMGDNCKRYAFVSRMVFGAGGWPWIDFDVALSS